MATVNALITSPTALVSGSGTSYTNNTGKYLLLMIANRDPSTGYALGRIVISGGGMTTIDLAINVFGSGSFDPNPVSTIVVPPGATVQFFRANSGSWAASTHAYYGYSLSPTF